METYRLSSKLREKEREYLIQTSNDITLDLVSTTVFVDGMLTETFVCPYPDEMNQDQLLALVKRTHGDKKKELEGLLQAYQRVAGLAEPETMFRLATALHHRKLYSEAVELLSAVTKLCPDHHRAFKQLGLTCLATGQTDNAIAAASQAVSFRPEFADYRNLMGEAYLAAGSVAQAIEEFKAAIGINIYYGDAYFNLGLAHVLQASRSTDRELTLQSIERVQEYLRKAALVYPEYRNHENYQEGLKALESHDFGRALNLFKGIVEARKELRRQEFLSRNKRLLLLPDAWTEEAVGEQIRSIQDHLKKHPNYLDLQTELVRCYLERAAMIWDKGIEECHDIIETHAEAASMARTLESADVVRQSMTETIQTITGEG